MNSGTKKVFFNKNEHNTFADINESKKTLKYENKCVKCSKSGFFTSVRLKNRSIIKTAYERWKILEIIIIPVVH